MIEELEQQEVDGVVRGAPAVVDFWMENCPPCNMMEPKLKAAAAEHEDVAVYRVKVQEGDALLDRFHIEAMPAVLFFRDGEVVARVEGLVHSADLQAAFRRVEP